MNQWTIANIWFIDNGCTKNHNKRKLDDCWFNQISSSKSRSPYIVDHERDMPLRLSRIVWNMWNTYNSSKTAHTILIFHHISENRTINLELSLDRKLCVLPNWKFENRWWWIFLKITTVTNIFIFSHQSSKSLREIFMELPIMVNYVLIKLHT